MEKLSNKKELFNFIDEIPYIQSFPESFSQFDLSILHNSPLMESKIQQILQSRLSQDMTYADGHILGAMTQPGHKFAQEIYKTYMEKNLGDPGLIPATREIEQETIQMIGQILNDTKVKGNIVSGGTEANLIAMMLARNSKSYISRPEIVIPESAHYSFDKAAMLMGLKIQRAKVNSDFSLDMNHFESLINENTIALVGIAGTTALGLIDPLKEIGKLAEKYNIYYHVDGAFGGLIFPFLRSIGHQIPEFDLSIPQIISYTVDPHKFGMGVNPTGGFLVRDVVLEKFGFQIPYLAGGGFKSFNILGTRPGASAISFWALLHKMGYQGFEKIAQETWKNTQYLMEGLEAIPEISLATTPIAPILGLQLSKKTSLSLDKFDSKLRARGWALGKFTRCNLMRVVLMPYITQAHIDVFLNDLKKIF